MDTEEEQRGINTGFNILRIFAVLALLLFALLLAAGLALSGHSPTDSSPFLLFIALITPVVFIFQGKSIKLQMVGGAIMGMYILFLFITAFVSK